LIGEKKMQEPLLDDALSQPTYSYEPEKALHVKRRQFLQTVGIVSVGLALAPKIVLAQDSDFARWRDTVNGFVYTVCNDRRAQGITSRIDGLRLVRRAVTRDFHYFYSAALIFVGATSPEEVMCGNGFEVNQFPFYDARCPCGSITDLNAFEIRRVSNSREIQKYNCVLTPHGRRTSLEYADHANYRRTASSYGLNPDQYVPEAKRVFRGRGRAVYGFQVADKADLENNVSKPKRDVLLSSQDL
jgi:hypothetical protein